MRKAPFLLIAVLLSVSFLTIAQSTSENPKPSVKETKDWIIEKLNRYSISGNTVNKAISYKVTEYQSYDNYQYIIEDDKLIINYTQKISDLFTNGYKQVVTNNITLTIYISDIDKISFVSSSNEASLPKYLSIELKKGKTAKEEYQQSSIDSNNKKESRNYSNSTGVKLGGLSFNIDGELNLENRLNTAFNNLIYSSGKKEAY